MSFEHEHGLILFYFPKALVKKLTNKQTNKQNKIGMALDKDDTGFYLHFRQHGERFLLVKKKMNNNKKKKKTKETA